MIFHTTLLEDAWLIELEARGDERGSFARTFCVEEFGSHGLATVYPQQNMSFSKQRGTLRGFHYQQAPYEEAKLVRCLRGRILDVIVDLRPGSTSYMHHQGFELSQENRHQLYVPAGFAHGFQTLCDDVEVSYLVSAPYHPASERGLRYNDPSLGVEWPLPISVISKKDETWPLLGQ